MIRLAYFRHQLITGLLALCFLMPSLSYAAECANKQGTAERCGSLCEQELSISNPPEYNINWVNCTSNCVYNKNHCPREEPKVIINNTSF